MAARSCIVTGGAGFIGCAISADLMTRFDRVVAVDMMHPQVHKTQDRPAGLAEGVELMRLDITDATSWDQILATVQPAVVVHLAAETGTGQSLTEATRHAHTNVTGTAAMLDAFARHTVVPERILLCSSRAVYGEGGWRDQADGKILYPGYRTREQLAKGAWDFEAMDAIPSSAAETRTVPTSVYGATKLTQEHILYSWAAAYGTTPIVLRLQNVYGPGQSLSNPYTGIVSLFCRLARTGASIPLYEDGRMLRDFVLIDDVAAAIVAALDSTHALPAPLDIGTGAASSIAEAAHLIAALYGAPAPHVCGLYRYGDVRHAACLIGPTLKTLNWRPRYTLESGLIRLKSWIDRQLALEEEV